MTPRLALALLWLVPACGKTGKDHSSLDDASDTAMSETEEGSETEEPSDTDEPHDTDAPSSDTDVSSSDTDSDTNSDTDSDTEDPSDTDGPMNTCPAPSGGPTMVSEITEDTTFTADGSPYIIDHGISIRATLTLDPCAEVLIGPGVQVTVRDAGSIVGIGTEEQPIRIGALDEEQPWSNIRVAHGNLIRLAHTTIEDGGDFGDVHPNYGAMIFAQAVGGGPDVLDFDHVTMRGSATQGILLIDGARFAATSTSLTITECAHYPVNMWANGLSTLPDGDYTGNEIDAVLLVGSGAAAISEDVTMHDRGVPYVVGNDVSNAELRVVSQSAAASAVLTIAPGVELRFGSGGVLHVDRGSVAGTAALVAVGSDDDEIVFTSDASTPAAGDWLGVYFWNVPHPESTIQHARVEYAGGVSQTGSGSCTTDGIGTHDAAIRFLGTGGAVQPDAPDGVIVTDTTIVASAGSGFDRGWFGEPIDYASANSFDGIAHCTQSFPHPVGGSCPAPAPCPAADE